MPSKKKPRPLFEVPVEIGAGRESGWVYRSGTPAKETPLPHANTGTSVGAESACTLAMAIATLTRSFVLAVTIAVLPMKIGVYALQSLAKPDETR